jgi:hypothetical protein
MAPLILLVGRNNTGKSYIATLLWALTSAQTLIGREEARERRPDWYKAFIAKVDKKEAARIKVTETLANELIEHFNFELAQNGRELLKEVFAYDGFERTHIRVEADRPFVPFSAAVHAPESQEPDTRRSTIRFSIIEAETSRSRHMRIAAPPAVRRRAEGCRPSRHGTYLSNSLRSLQSTWNALHPRGAHRTDAVATRDDHAVIRGRLTSHYETATPPD